MAELLRGFKPVGDVFAPDSTVITGFVPLPRQKVATSLFLNPAVRASLLFVLLAALSGALTPTMAQESSAQFSDLATRAAAARDRGNLPLAIQLYKQAEEANPNWQEGWWYLGVLQYSSNQYAGAIDAFNHLLQLVPTAVPAMALRGLCEFETGAYDDSLRDLEHAVAHGAANEPHNEQIIRYHLALLLTRAGRFPDALLQYKALASLHADAPDLMAGIGLAGMRTASLPQRINAGDREFYESAGNAGYVFLSGDDEKADGLFASLFAKYPQKAGLHFFYGYLLYPHDPEMAGEQFRQELLIKPDSETYALMALTLIFEGHFAEALTPAQAAYDAEPDLEIAQVALGRALSETGDKDRGSELLRKVAERDPGDLEAHLGLASIYSQSGNREEEARERKICRDLAH
jgi:tetratricopeptide (TPR) repeat protein